MDEDKKLIQGQLAKSVLEKGAVKCPKCASLVQWEDSEQYNPDGSRDRYFWCSNESCELHQRDVVKVSISKGFLQTFQQNFSKIGQGMIAALFGALSVWGYGYINGDKDKPKDNSQEIATAVAAKEKENKELVASIEKLEEQLELLKNKGETPSDISSGTDNSDSKERISSLENMIDSLEGVVDKQNEKITELKAAAKDGEITSEQMMGLGMYYSDDDNDDRDVTLAKKYLFSTLENPDNDLADDNKIIVRRLVELRMNPLMELAEYDKVLKYIKYLPLEERNIATAQVYWYYADATAADYQSYKKYKLLSLKHYLQSATMNVLHGQDKKDAIKLIEGLQSQNAKDLSPLSSFQYPANSGNGIIEAISSNRLNKPAIYKFLSLGIMKNLDS